MFFSFSLAFAEETVINVSGPDILTDGACYSATGGTAPYLWKTSEGSIDNSGCVSNISAQCGTAAITASDDCRATGAKEVTLHGGVGAISISGSDAPQNGYCYVANNAVGAVQWGITKGSINSNGCVSNISDQCGAATVTATDSCGETAVKDVRMPNGVWFTVESCNKGLSGACGGSYNHCDTISGINRIIVNGAAWALSAYWGGPGCPVYDCYPGTVSPDPYCVAHAAPFAQSSYIQEWRCQ